MTPVQDPLPGVEWPRSNVQWCTACQGFHRIASCMEEQ